MKKILFIIVPALLIAILIFLFIQYRTKLNSQKGALQVTSSPAGKVYLNNKYIGTTPLSKTDASGMIQVGNYTIRLVPIDASLSEYQEKITISKGTLTVVDRKFGKGTLSEGYVISLAEKSDKKLTELEVISFPVDAQIELDSNEIGKTPLLYKKPTESDHLLKIKKNGYKEKTVGIRTPAGFRLTVIAYLSVKADEEIGSPAPIIASQSATPALPSALTPTQGTAKVKILDTPTGFLRVRASYDLGSAIITTVSPGNTFPMISERDGWFEIKLPDGITGWISSQYAKKE